jgi:hypothetical protein
MVVEKYNAGIVIKQFSNEAYCNDIQNLTTTSFDKVAIRQGAKEFFSLDTGVEKYSSVYEKIMH